MLGDFADVQQSVGAGEKLDERAELREAHDFAKIGFADFGTGGDVADHLQGRISAGSAGGENVHGAVFQDVDLDAGGFDNGADFLAARPDEVTDFVLWDFQLEEARGVGGNLLAAFAERLFHDVENLQAGLLGLRESFAHHLNANAQDLDVHLQSSDALARAGNFEVHIAVMIFRAGDVRENGIFVLIADDEAHGDTRARSLHGNSGIHQR